MLADRQITISIDGRGGWQNNVLACTKLATNQNSALEHQEIRSGQAGQVCQRGELHLCARTRAVGIEPETANPDRRQPPAGLAGRAVEREAPRVAQAVRPHLRGRGRERVAGRRTAAVDALRPRRVRPAARP